MEFNNLDCNKMYKFYKSCKYLNKIKNIDDVKKDECKIFTKNYIKNCNNFIKNIKLNKLTFHDYN
jgi:hypothetical protein